MRRAASTNRSINPISFATMLTVGAQVDVLLTLYEIAIRVLYDLLLDDPES